MVCLYLWVLKWILFFLLVINLMKLIVNLVFFCKGIVISIIYEYSR